MVNNQKGFTLVEVIVVAVIVAVLAAVAIPLYNGYIHDSRLNVAQNLAGTVASACGATKQQEPANVNMDGPFTGPTRIIMNGEDGVPNNIMVPDGFMITITFDGQATTTGTVVCNSTKDATVESDVYNF